MSHNTIDGALLKEMIISGANLLEQNRELVDSLNVFPVPDGDTGTNMSLTMRSTVSEIEAKDEHDASRMLAMAAKGALKGARGNSGVILSQILRGFSRGIEGSETIGAETFVKGLRRGADTAYKAVMKPKEGTILTVIRVIAEDAERYVKRHPGDLGALLGKVVRSGEAILEKTPDMLPALKEAGVVDSGGQGLVFIFRGWLAAFQGDRIEEAPEAEPAEEIAEEAELKYRYRTEFVILSLREGVTEDDLNRYRTRLGRIGEGVSLEGTDGDQTPIRVRVQTNDPGKAIQYACDLGEISGLTFVNLAEQRREAKRRAEEEARRREEAEKEAARLAEEARRRAEEAEKNAPPKPYGIVAVSIGEGFSRIFSDLGVDVIVEGGQTMNPSIEDIGGAIEKIHAENVFVLPNNSNVILAATQAADLTEGNVFVLPTKNTAMGIGAVVAFNPEATPEENRETMTAAAEQVKTGQITFAVRDTVFEEKEIHEGDIIGIHNGRIETVGQDVHDVALGLVKDVVEEGDTLITVYYGQDTEESAAESLRDEIAELFPDMDVVSQYGGQPLYYYLISAE